MTNHILMYVYKKNKKIKKNAMTCTMVILYNCLKVLKSFLSL